MAIGIVIFPSVCVILLSFWIRRSYLNFLRSTLGSIEGLPPPVQEGEREGWEICYGKDPYYCCEWRENGHPCYDGD